MSLHICAPPALATLWQMFDCPYCEKSTVIVGNTYEWYDTIWTCTECGDSYSAEGRMERPFKRAWRQESIADALRLLEQAIPASEYQP